ncbi:MAG: sigma 54-interacting transcriptional regulator [Kofleriaceae bacterium]
MRDRANEERTTLKGAAETVLHARTTLVLYHRDGATVAQLDKDRPLIIGRGAPSDVAIPDPGLSRQHARFTWNDQGLWVDDLDSTNGTKKNGERIKSTRIVPTDEVSIGPVMVKIHIISSVDQELRGFDGHDRFVAMLADEIVRARTFQRSLAVMLVKAANAKDHISTWASRLRMRMRPVDRVGIYGPSAVLVALPEATPERVRTLSAELTGGEPRLACNVVTFPGDGGSVEELIAALKVAKRAGAVKDDDETAAVIIKSTAMKQVMQTVKRLAQSTIAVLIHGETGTGKEVITRAIHDNGPRKKGPLQAINCAAIPQTLIESVLFGHEHGAYTGADRSARGIFEQADGGTVLLDEIGELAASAQAALLRVLETKKVTRIGGDKEIAVDVRVIAATHRDLEAMVEAGMFRQDLLYRLNSMTLRIPALRERVEEIRPLAERFLKEASRQAGGDVREIDPAALAALESYNWPGNVRELRNAIERAVVLAEGKAILVTDLADRITRAPEPPTDDGDVPSDYRDHVRKYEAQLIVRALHKHSGNQTEAAKALGLPLRTLVHKIQLYGIKKKFDR